MLANRQLTMRHLLDSKNGIHLTAYLNNKLGDPEALQSQLKAILKRAEFFLSPVLAAHERERFLRPLIKLCTDHRTLLKMRGNIGFFRTQDSFRVLSLPVDVRTECIIASSFHVKPLLKWLQSDQTFLLLGIGETEARLYCGSQHSLIPLENLNYQEWIDLRRQRRLGPSRGIRATISIIYDWLDEVLSNTQQKIYVAGDRRLSDVFIKYARQLNVVKTPVWSSFDASNVTMIADVVRRICKRDLSLKLEKAFVEFSTAPTREISEIAAAAARGAVRKLMVADELLIFGKFDAKTGELTLHPEDLDHEDDDLLDDLAQTVLAQGGEVYVAKPNQIPHGLPLLAIVEEKAEYIAQLT